jgi:hypothetical protein
MEQDNQYLLEEYHKIQRQERFINMAVLQSPIRIYPNSSWHLQQRKIATFFTADGSPLYIHFKTSLGQGIDTMYMIEAVGYNYGNAYAIRCAWGFQWSYGVVRNVGLQNGYPGMNADGVYASSDGYLCIRAYSGGHYFNGFMLNAYATRTDQTHYNISILAASQNSNSGNFY